MISNGSELIRPGIVSHYDPAQIVKIVLTPVGIGDAEGGQHFLENADIVKNATRIFLACLDGVDFSDQAEQLEPRIDIVRALSMSNPVLVRGKHDDVFPEI